MRECRDLNRLPEQLGEMKGLKMIDVSYTAIEKLPDSITHLKKLVELNLYSCKKFLKLPEQLGEMKGLEKLIASFTAIEKLPDSITHLKKLVELNLRYCKKLTNLPEQLGEMKALKKLNAGRSAIEKLPDSITHLKELFMLDLVGCRKLRRIPEQIGKMECLRTFSAGDTAIEQLPDSLGGLYNLVELDFSLCRNLRNLPYSICKLKLLKKLYLNECSKLERLPEQLWEMQCLESLYADNTAIEEVPDSIGLLSRLQELCLKGCEKLKYVPESIWDLTSIRGIYLESGDLGIISLPGSVEKLSKLTTLHLSCNARLCLPMILQFPSLEHLTLTDEGQILSSVPPVSLSQLSNLRVLTMNKCTSLGSSLPDLPLNLQFLYLCDHSSLEQLPDLSSLKLLGSLDIQRCVSLQSISLLPSHLDSLSVQECTSLQDLPDLSILKELVELNVTRCNNLKSISLKPSSLQVGQPRLPFNAYLPNQEVAEWFTYKSSGHTVSFDTPPSFESNFLGLALWVVYTCSATNGHRTYIRAVITNNTESITENYKIYVHTLVGEAQSSVQCITFTGEKMPMKSGDKIKVSFRNRMYSSTRYSLYSDDKVQEVPIGEVKVKMCGVHVIQVRPSTSVY